MIYFHAYTLGPDGCQTVAIAVVEDGRHAARYEAQGYTQCTRATFRVAWQLRDTHTLMQLRRAARVAPQRPNYAQAAKQMGIDRVLR